MIYKSLLCVYELFFGVNKIIEYRIEIGKLCIDKVLLFFKNFFFLYIKNFISIFICSLYL